MAEPEWAALKHIRRVVDSILGEPTPQPVTASPPIEAVPSRTTLLPVPYVTQLGEGADKYSHDCGAAAGVMLVKAYTDQTPTVDEFFERTGQHADYPLSFQQITIALNHYGVSVDQRSSLKLGDLALTLSSGRPAILMVKPSVLQQAGLSSENFNGPKYIVAIGLDLESVFVHDPLQRDKSGQSLGIPWLILYQAWTQIGRDYSSPFLERAALVPRVALVRRVRIRPNLLNVREGPGNHFNIVGQVKSGDAYEIFQQKGEWGQIDEKRWISLAYVQDI